MKKKKGMSYDEKKEKMLNIFHKTLSVYNYKEFEKFCVKIGMRILKSISDSKRNPGNTNF